MRFLPKLLTLLLAIAIAAGIFRVSHSYFVSEELAKAEGRLSLFRAAVDAEFNRFSHLTFVLSRDPIVIDTAMGQDTDALNMRLRGFADQAGLEAIYLMDQNGLTIAASNHHLPSSFVGQNYSFRPYFSQAMAGQQGRFYAIGTTTGLPGYFITDAVRDGAGDIRGVIAIKIGFAQLEQSWRGSGEQVLLSNADGVVLLSSDPAWRYRMLQDLTPNQRARIQASRQFPGQELAPLDWAMLPDQRAEIAGAEHMHLTATTQPHGWDIHYFASDDRADARASLVTALAVLLAGVGLVIVQIQRNNRVAAALRRSEMEELKLRKANERLAVEITERTTAERRLQRTQQELQRASRLAALGQLSASVTHELGQPIAAMRNHLTAAEFRAQGQGDTPQTKLTQTIFGLVDRMEGITRQLKFFARTGQEEFNDVDLCGSLRAALALVEPNVDAFHVDVQVDLPDHPVWVRGSNLRIEQVMTNLLRNAVDAVEDSDAPQIHVRVGVSDQNHWFDIRDNGHGLGQATLADLQEPFVTTRESGRGMGLGLAISSSIVSDHGGTMVAENVDTGGAIFTVTFPISDGDTV